jgi:hypothetical protein
MKILSSLVLMTISISSFAQNASQSHQHHQHGKGVLEIAIEGNALSGSLEIPLEALLGFEHAPKNNKEKIAQSKLETKLDSIDTWLEINQEAQCIPKSSKAKLERSTQSKHSDLVYTFSYACANPGALKEMRLPFIKEYKGIKEIKVEVAGSKGQRLVIASPKSPIIRF